MIDELRSRRERGDNSSVTRGSIGVTLPLRFLPLKSEGLRPKTEVEVEDEDAAGSGMADLGYARPVLNVGGRRQDCAPDGPVQQDDWDWMLCLPWHE